MRFASRSVSEPRERFVKRQSPSGGYRWSRSRPRSRGARLMIGLGIVGALVGSTPGLAAAVPPPPPNPSDEQIQQADTRVGAGVDLVSELINQVATADAQLAELDNAVAIKREDVNRALVDLQNARGVVDAAVRAVDISQRALRDAGAMIEFAQKDFDKFAVSSYTQGTNISLFSTLIGSDGPRDLLDRAQILKLLAANQKAVLDGLQRARTEQANRDSANRAAKQEAEAAEAAAAARKADAEQAIVVARNALSEQTAKKEQIEADRAVAQAQLDAARAQSEGLQGQRQAYETWDQKRRAEEARQAALEAAAKEAAEAARARLAENQAARERAAALAAEQRPHTALEDTIGTDAAESDGESSAQNYSYEDYSNETYPGGQDTSDGESSTENSTDSSPDVSDLSASEAIEIVIDRGLSQMGVTYAWGGGDENGPTKGIRDGGVADSYGDFNKVGFDCSGLMVYAFAGIGISLPHYSGYQYTAGEQVPTSEMQRGDMLFWGPSASQHVALYLGDGKMLEAPQSGSVVKISPVRWDGMTPYAVRMVS
ncbi:MAG: C40 family peptidase [Rhodococcus sp.]|nr:C40 family peptidase [Rhodococcus sp. (in: high G+C Gram-positive bacteria)]